MRVVERPRVTKFAVKVLEDRLKMYILYKYSIFRHFVFLCFSFVLFFLLYNVTFSKRKFKYKDYDVGLALE